MPFTVMVLSYLAVFILGIIVARTPWQTRQNSDSKNSDEPEVYMIINLQPLDEKKMKEYQSVAIPLAEKAGMEFLAANEPVVLGGQWPYKGSLVIERFRSLRAVQEYWDSAEYQEARKLLDGADIRDFTVVVEAD